MSIDLSTDDPKEREFYHHTLVTLQSAGVPFLVGGAYAFAHYTGIERQTKDFDIFTSKEHCEQAMQVLIANGYKADITYPHWLGKAYSGDYFVDVIFSSGNGVATVDDLWFEHAVDSNVLDHPVKLCPPEEMLWSKMFIMERERYDGADVAHLILAQGEQFDWQRLMKRFDPHWRVLLTHLVLFGFIYPNERSAVPDWVMDDLLRRLQEDRAAPAGTEKICGGTLLSRAQYLVDIGKRGYRDARIVDGTMSPEEAIHWSVAIHEDDH